MMNTSAKPTSCDESTCRLYLEWDDSWKLWRAIFYARDAAHLLPVVSATSRSLTVEIPRGLDMPSTRRLIIQFSPSPPTSLDRLCLIWRGNYLNFTDLPTLTTFVSSPGPERKSLTNPQNMV